MPKFSTEFKNQGRSLLLPLTVVALRRLPSKNLGMGMGWGRGGVEKHEA